MKGHLDITCAPGGGGFSQLREQSFRAPVHLSKPFRDGDTLVVNLVNPTAGTFDDDEVEVSVAVEGGARLLLTTPSACRVYRSRNGSPAVVRQAFRVGSGAYLEFFPEPFIPHAGARYHQVNRIDVADGGRVAFFEWITPGRVARGETFEYADLRWETDVVVGGRLVARERFALRPDDESLLPLRSAFGPGHYLSCFVVDDTGPPPIDEVHALESDAVFSGCSALAASGWVAKAVCADSLTARKTLAALRTIAHRALGTTPARLARF